MSCAGNVRGLIWLLAVSFGCALPATARGHAFDPDLLEVAEVEPGVLDILWKTSLRAVDGRPASSSANELERPALQPSCRPVGPARSAVLTNAVTLRWRVDCEPGELDRGAIRFDAPGVGGRDVVVRVERLDGEILSGVLRNPGDEVALSTGQGGVHGLWATTVGTYLALGVEHIVSGVDHLLFVFALILLVKGRRRLVWTITAFTSAHSVTLALAVLGVVDVRTGPVEAGIALSIVLLAAELARPRSASPTLTRRYPWVVAAAFGLLHGLGFAAALSRVGLPADEIPLALGSFNVGVELGQLGFVVVLFGLDRATRVLAGRAVVIRRLRHPHVAAYPVGIIATAWVMQRVASLWTGGGS